MTTGREEVEYPAGYPILCQAWVGMGIDRKALVPPLFQEMGGVWDGTLAWDRISVGVPVADKIR